MQQAKDGSSLEDQQKKIEEFVQAKFNRPVDKFFIDAGVSGAKPLTERPASRELTDVMDKNDIIVATKLDRFARSVKEMLTTIPILEETGITLYFCELFGDMPVVMPKNPEEVGLKKKFNMARQMSEMVISMMASFAEMENQRRRYEKEKEDAYEYGGFAFAREALSLIDNLERSKQILQNDESLKNSDAFADPSNSLPLYASPYPKVSDRVFKSPGVETAKSVIPPMDP